MKILSLCKTMLFLQCVFLYDFFYLEPYRNFRSTNITRKTFYQVYVRISLLKGDLKENADLQISEDIAISPVSVCLCHFKWELTENEE